MMLPKMVYRNLYIAKNLLFIIKIIYELGHHKCLKLLFDSGMDIFEPDYVSLFNNIKIDYVESDLLGF